jgi:hypothetical protein
MQSGPIAKNLAFIEYDFAIVDADHGPELVIEELACVFTFFVNRTRPPIDSVIFPRSNTLNFRTWSSATTSRRCPFRR